MFRFKQEQLKVYISNISTCRVIHVNPNHVQCLPVDANYPVDVDIPLMVRLTIDNILYCLIYYIC